MKKYKNIVFICLIVISAFVLDFITKRIAINNLIENNRVAIINNFFYFTLCYNTGGAWSIFSGNTLFLVIISVIALIFIIFTMVKSSSKFYLYSCSLFIGGLLGNLYDRVFYKKVTDFLDFIIFGYDFPVFNIADCCICIATVLIIFAFIKEEKNGTDSVESK